MLRPGAITYEMIEKVAGIKIQLSVVRNETRAPRLLESHYSPKAKVIIGACAVRGDGLAFAIRDRSSKAAFGN